MKNENTEKIKNIINEVKTLFELADCRSDFHIDKQDDKIVCGAWNRVYIYADGTYKASFSHCLDRMIKTAKILDIEII